ncbi:MAG: 5'/3'-nucleotidase SurE [Alphaproteobacteria bacterium]|nr:5'/3'-nucleotidase SurE [Alphaproteobacteria bacterium]
MRILISNDDGIHAYGLDPLAEALAPLGEVWIVAPEREQSTQSHALTLHKPLRVRERDARRFAVSGTPADCVYMAVLHLMPEPPGLVVSGINRGGNLGNDVLYSGTVAAAMEACLFGLPAIAASLEVDWRVRARDHHWDTAASIVASLARDVLAHGLPRRTLLNLNVPDVPASQLKGIRATRMGIRHYENEVTERLDQRGQPYFWIGGTHVEFEAIAGTDGPAVEAGYASVTPLQADLTHPGALERLRDWETLRGPGAP